MRVCIDCSPLLMRSAGVKTYVYYLTQHLLAAFGPESVLAFPFLGQIGELDHDRSVAGRWATLVRLGLLSMANRRMISPAWLVPPADLFHASNQMRRATGHGKLTGTIHDVTSWLMPDLHRSGTLIADREYAELIWKRADGLIAVSHKSKRDAVEVLGIAADKITVVYHGIADSYFEVTAAQISKMREIYRIQKPYVLFLSTIEPRKNLDRLITAYESMSNTTRSEFDLLVGGPYGWNSEATMQRLVQSPKGVRYVGD